jgi:hypothetical protein
MEQAFISRDEQRQVMDGIHHGDPHGLQAGWRTHTSSPSHHHVFPMAPVDGWLILPATTPFVKPPARFIEQRPGGSSLEPIPAVGISKLPSKVG